MAKQVPTMIRPKTTAAIASSTSLWEIDAGNENENENAEEARARAPPYLVASKVPSSKAWHHDTKSAYSVRKAIPVKMGIHWNCCSKATKTLSRTGYGKSSRNDAHTHTKY